MSMVKLTRAVLGMVTLILLVGCGDDATEPATAEGETNKMVLDADFEHVCRLEMQCRSCDVELDRWLIVTEVSELHVYDLLADVKLLATFPKPSSSFAFHEAHGVAVLSGDSVQLIKADGSITADYTVSRPDDLKTWERIEMKFSADGAYLWLVDPYTEESSIRLLRGHDLAPLDELSLSDSLREVQIGVDRITSRLAVVNVAGDSFLSLGVYGVVNGQIELSTFLGEGSDFATDPIELGSFSSDGSRFCGQDYYSVLREWSWPDGEVLADGGPYEWLGDDEYFEHYSLSNAGYFDNETILTGLMDIEDRITHVAVVEAGDGGGSCLGTIKLPDPAAFLEFATGGYVVTFWLDTVDVYRLTFNRGDAAPK